jgi:TPR repeat protein
MTSVLRAVIVSIIFTLTFAASATAGPLKDADAAYRKGDYATALRLMRPLAEEGDAEAQFKFGLHFYGPVPSGRDYAEAVKWFRKAAEQGVAAAQYYLGNMYDNGLGVPQDYVRAHMWFNLAAAQGGENAKKYPETGSRNT